MLIVCHSLSTNHLSKYSRSQDGRWARKVQFSRQSAVFGDSRLEFGDVRHHFQRFFRRLTTELQCEPILTIGHAPLLTLGRALITSMVQMASWTTLHSQCNIQWAGKAWRQWVLFQLSWTSRNCTRTTIANGGRMEIRRLSPRTCVRYAILLPSKK